VFQMHKQKLDLKGPFYQQCRYYLKTKTKTGRIVVNIGPKTVDKTGPNFQYQWDCVFLSN